MDPREYTEATAQPDVFAFAELDATVRCLRTVGSRLANVVEQAGREAIVKPPHHDTPASPDFYRLSLAEELADRIVDDLLDAEADAVSPTGETTPEAAHRAALVDRWNRYACWLREGAA